jgi:hypothetical protein
MKKLFSILMLFIFVASFSHCFAESKPKSVGVVIIGPSDFLTPDFIDIATKELKKKFDPAIYNLSIGDVPQGKYQKYWDDKGFLTEQPITKKDVLDFSSNSNYDYVLFLIIKPPSTELQKYSVFRDRSRVSLEITAVYVDNSQNSILSNFSNTQQDDSLTSQLRARKGAYEKILEFVSANLK